MISEDELTMGNKRLLSVDHPLIIPCGEAYKYIITSSDVLHS